MTYTDPSIVVLDDVTYKKLVDGTATVVSYSGNATDLVIPTTVSDCSVTKIGEGAFENNETLSSISLPNSIIVIGARAFKNCTNLSSMTTHD